MRFDKLSVTFALWTSSRYDFFKIRSNWHYSHNYRFLVKFEWPI